MFKFLRKKEERLLGNDAIDVHSIDWDFKNIQLKEIQAPVPVKATEPVPVKATEPVPVKATEPVPVKATEPAIQHRQKVIVRQPVIIQRTIVIRKRRRHRRRHK